MLIGFKFCLNQASPFRMHSLLCYLIVLCLTVVSINACNELVCAQVVSKCMLTKACKCDLQNCSTCCKECFNCLDSLFHECCSCVGMCPRPKIPEWEPSKQSHVGDLSEPIPTLFQSLVEGPDSTKLWTTKTYPIDFKIVPVNKKEMVTVPEQEIDWLRESGNVKNCSVAFITQCTSWTKCEATCHSMGATSYRWFHDGCCECVGDTCINYGLNYSDCAECSLPQVVLADASPIFDNDVEDNRLR